jgi:hypothetical protein
MMQVGYNLKHTQEYIDNFLFQLDSECSHCQCAALPDYGTALLPVLLQQDKEDISGNFLPGNSKCLFILFLKKSVSYSGYICLYLLIFIILPEAIMDTGTARARGNTKLILLSVTTMT